MARNPYMMDGIIYTKIMCMIFFGISHQETEKNDIEMFLKNIKKSISDLQIKGVEDNILETILKTNIDVFEKKKEKTEDECICLGDRSFNNKEKENSECKRIATSLSIRSIDMDTYTRRQIAFSLDSAINSALVYSVSSFLNMDKCSSVFSIVLSPYQYYSFYDSSGKKIPNLCSRCIMSSIIRSIYMKGPSYSNPKEYTRCYYSLERNNKEAMEIITYKKEDVEIVLVGFDVLKKNISLILTLCGSGIKEKAGNHNYNLLPIYSEGKKTVNSFGLSIDDDVGKHVFKCFSDEIRNLLGSEKNLKTYRNELRTSTIISEVLKQISYERSDDENDHSMEGSMVKQIRCMVFGWIPKSAVNGWSGIVLNEIKNQKKSIEKIINRNIQDVGERKAKKDDNLGLYRKILDEPRNKWFMWMGTGIGIIYLTSLILATSEK